MNALCASCLFGIPFEPFECEGCDGLFCFNCVDEEFGLCQPCHVRQSVLARAQSKCDYCETMVYTSDLTRCNGCDVDKRLCTLHTFQDGRSRLICPSCTHSYSFVNKKQNTNDSYVQVLRVCTRCRKVLPDDAMVECEFCASAYCKERCYLSMSALPFASKYACHRHFGPCRDIEGCKGQAIFAASNHTCVHVNRTLIWCATPCCTSTLTASGDGSFVASCHAHAVRCCFCKRCVPHLFHKTIDTRKSRLNTCHATCKESIRTFISICWISYGFRYKDIIDKIVTLALLYLSTHGPRFLCFLFFF